MKEGKIFGPQPYLAIKTKDGKFYHDNLDLVELDKEWSFTFDEDTIKSEDISILGVASNDKYANSFVKIIYATEE